MAENRSTVLQNQDTNNLNGTQDNVVLNLPEFQMGTAFEGKKGAINIDLLANDKQIICLYFAAGFCYPCKAFTPKLIEFYNEVNTEEKLLEIVLVPFDKSEDESKKFYRTMPWISLPFNLERVEAYRSNYGVRGIPQLVVLRKDGSILVQDAGKDVLNRGEDAFLDWVQKIKAEELIGLMGS